MSQIGPCTHTILVYPNLKTIREVYSSYFHTNSIKGTEMIVILPYYETIESVKNNLLKDAQSTQNYDIMIGNGSLIIRDSNTLFDRDIKSSNSFLAQDHSSNLQIVQFLSDVISHAKQGNKDEISVWIDTGTFHNFEGGLESLLCYERSVPAIFESTPLKQFCMYHQKDFELRLNKFQESEALDYHQKRLMLLSNS
ncbi:MAG TPA: hypothetical protein VLD84_07475 [Nitrososphaeraceae archaeon]|nr:hypothetical protein [Nitrososphaeraceae archaeon]